MKRILVIMSLFLITFMLGITKVNAATVVNDFDELKAALESTESNLVELGGNITKTYEDYQTDRIVITAGNHTLDLKNYTISYTILQSLDAGVDAITIKNNASLTINGTGGISLAYEGSSFYSKKILTLSVSSSLDNPKLTINGGTYTSITANNSSNVISGSKGEIELNGGTYTSNGSNVIFSGGATYTINGGLYKVLGTTAHRSVFSINTTNNNHRIYGGKFVVDERLSSDSYYSITATNMSVATLISQYSNIYANGVLKSHSDTTITSSYSQDDLEIKPTFSVREYESSLGNVSVVGDVTRFEQGDTVTIEVTDIAENYELKDGTLKVTDSDEELETPLSNNTFVMPGYDVVLLGEFYLTQLATPSGLLATKGTQNSIHLSWDNVTGADGYKVYRATSKTGKYTQVAVLDADDNEYTNSGLTYGKTYYYKVKAYNAIAEGSYSSVVSVYARPDTTETSVKGYGYNSVKIGWTKVDGASGYVIYRATSLNGKYSAIKTITKGSTISYTNSSLSLGKTYYYKVRAYKTVGRSKIYSLYSNIVNQKTMPAPVNFKVNRNTYNSLKLTWGKVSGTTYYQIYKCVHSNINDSVFCDKFKTTKSTSYVVSGLELENWYLFNVTACRTYKGKTTCGVLDEENIKSEQVSPAMPKVTATNESATSIKLTWSEVTGAAMYYCDYQPADMDPNGFWEYNDLEESVCTLTGLETGETYRIYVFAVGGESRSAESIPYEVIIKAIPNTPVITARLESYGNIRVSWDEVEDATSYKVYRATSKTGKYSLIGTTSELSYLDTGRAHNKTYYYKVRAVVAAGGFGDVYSNYSSYKSAKSYLVTPKPVVTSKSYNTINITYPSVSGATGYKIYRATSKNGYYRLIKTTSATDFDNIKLSFNKGYYYKVRAYRKVGRTTYYSSYSSKMYAKTALTKPVVTGFEFLTGIQVNYTSVLGATKYEIYRSSDNVNFEKILTTTALSKMEENLEYGTYYYKVRAIRVVSKKNYYGPYSEVFQESYVDYSGSGGGIE